MKTAAKPRATVRWFSSRPKGKRRRRSTPRQILAFRLADFATLFRARYGHVLPDDDAGRDDIVPVLQHLAAMPQGIRHCEQWLDLWAPWLSRAESRDIIADAAINRRIWTADQLAWRYRVTKEERQILGLTTIGAIDQAKAARTKARRDKARKRKTEQRQAQGAKPRAEYEATSTQAAKPWLREGCSRATWYRRRHATNET